MSINPVDVQSGHQPVRAAAVASDLAEEAVLNTVLAAWRARHIRSLVLKGAALARTVYPASQTRTRRDLDLLVSADAFEEAAEVLRAMGLTEEPSSWRVSGQRHFQPVTGPPVDLHARLFAPAAFNERDQFERLWEQRQPVPRIDDAWTLGAADMLWHTCVHRVLHHNDSPAPVWSMDVRLQAVALAPEDWRRFCAVAARTRTRRVCAAGLRLACIEGGTAPVDSVLASLATDDEEPTAAFLGGALTEWRIQRLNWRHLPRWRDRLTLVLAHLFPPAEFMLAQEDAGARWRLPWLYVKRIARGWVSWKRPARRA